MSILLAAVPASLDSRLPDGPVHRLVFAVDIEGSTERNNLAKGELRRILYDLLDRALEAAGIGARHLEPYTDRGDSVLILIKPHDDVPKTLVLGQLVPILTTLLAEHNAAVMRPELRLWLRAAVHAGEVHEDDKGFYGDDLDTAFRLLEAPRLKKALREAAAAPLILVISEEIFHGVVEQGYLDDAAFEPLVRVRVGRRQHRGWVQIPDPLPPGCLGTSRELRGQPSAPPLSVVPALALQATPATGRPDGLAVAPVMRASRSAAPHATETLQGVDLATAYQELEQRQTQTGEPFDTEAGLARLKRRLSAG
jgi:hypothetical protein